MTESDVNRVLVELATLRATITTRLDAMVADTEKADRLHEDHENRLRALEAGRNEFRGGWRVITAGGLGVSVITAAAMRALGLA